MAVGAIAYGGIVMLWALDDDERDQITGRARSLLRRS